MIPERALELSKRVLSGHDLEDEKEEREWLDLGRPKTHLDGLNARWVPPRSI